MKVYTVIDLETTGLASTQCQITEIAAIKYSEHGQKLGTFHTYVKLEQGQKISEYTPHITEEICNEGLYEDCAVHMLKDFSRGTILIIQYAPFDLSFLNRTYISGEFEKNSDFICTRALAKVVNKKENPSLKHVAARYGIENNKHHQALNDCEVTWQVFQKLREEFGHIDLMKNIVMNFKDRPLKYTPVGASVITEVD